MTIDGKARTLRCWLISCREVSDGVCGQCRADLRTVGDGFVQEGLVDPLRWWFLRRAYRLLFGLQVWYRRLMGAKA